MGFSMVYDWATVLFVVVLVLPSIIRGYFVYRKCGFADGSIFEEIFLSLLITAFSAMLFIYSSLALYAMFRGMFSL